MTTKRAPHLVATVLEQRASMFEVAVPCEVFGLPRPELHDPWYRHLLCAVEPGPIDTGQGAFLDVKHGLEVLEEAGTIVVPPPYSGASADDPAPASRPALIDALRQAHARGARILSVCSGAFLLAETGLLDGRRATTHWFYAAEFARRFPKVDLDPGVLYVDEGSVMTSAGTAAGIDLCLHLVRLDLGAEVANAVARRMVVPPHRDGGQAQYVDAPVPSVEEGDALNGAMAWASANLAAEITVADLASRVAMSPRTFARRFVASTGTTPRQWLIAQRVLLAQRLLETTEESVERIAELSGFGGAAALRHHFERRLSCSPQRYRRTFRTALAS